MATEGKTFIPPNLTKAVPRGQLHLWCRQCNKPVDRYTAVKETDDTVSLTINCHGVNLPLRFISTEEFEAVTEACRWHQADALKHSDTGAAPDWLALW